jgi:hypothetical protein
VSDHRASSFNELVDLLFAESWQAPLGRFRSSFAYRGTNSAADDLTTSLCRLSGNFGDNEGHLLRNFRKYAHRDAVPGGDLVWNWLALAQHHGLPTRLLDWTFSPFVAMHFATQEVDQFNTDGAIWCVDYVRCHKFLPPPLRQALDDEQADVFTTEILGRAAPTLEAFDRLGTEQPFMVFLDPPSLDQRIVNQFALLSPMSGAEADTGQWLGQHPELWRRIVIPAELKWEVRDKLDQANVTERVLFPGLDGLSRWLKRYYGPRK